MVVIDASVLIDLLVESESGVLWRDRVMAPGTTLHAPHLIDIEAAHSIRRLARLGALPAGRAESAIENLTRLPLRRYGHLVLLPRVWELRENLSAYDASYVALAELLGTPLLTRDAKLSHSFGHSARIELLT